MTSIHDSRYSGASRTTNRRHNVRLLAFLLCIATSVLSRPSQASDLVIGRSAVQAIVASALFNDQGRWYLTKGKCYAYLENPKITLAFGRLVMDAHLSSRVGLEVGDSCVGTSLASDVQLSGKFVGSRSQVTLQDIRIDNVKDDATRQALDLLQSAAGASLTRAVDIDLLQMLRPATVPGTAIKVSATAVQIAGVTTQPDNVTVLFDIKLHAD